MKMKLREAISRYNNLAALTTQTYPTRLSYAISKNLKKLEDETKNYEEERKKVCERLAEKDEKGAPIIEDDKYVMTDANKKTLSKEVDDLLNMEVEVEIQIVDVSVLDQCDTSERYHVPTAKEIIALDFMLK